MRHFKSIHGAIFRSVKNNCQFFFFFFCNSTRISTSSLHYNSYVTIMSDIYKNYGLGQLQYYVQFTIQFRERLVKRDGVNETSSAEEYDGYELRKKFYYLRVPRDFTSVPTYVRRKYISLRNLVINTLGLIRSISKEFQIYAWKDEKLEDDE